jgi:transcriptional regulator with XRE-family HTH domain
MSTVSASQIKAARLLLGLTVGELASSANIGVATIKRFEASDGIPEHRSGNLDKVRVALEARGIEFLGDPIASPGVRLHKN